MNDLTRYEKELADELNHLALPDKDNEWNEMKKLLDNDNDIITPVPYNNLWLRRAMYAALFLLIIAVSCFFINRSREQNINKQTGKNETAANDNNKSQKENPENSDSKKIESPITTDAEIKQQEDVQNNNDPALKKEDNITANNENSIVDQQKNKTTGKKTNVNNTNVEQAASLAGTNDKKNLTATNSTGTAKAKGSFKNKDATGRLKTNLINPGLDEDHDDIAKTETKTKTKPANKKIHTRNSSALKITNGEMTETEVSNVTISQQSKTKPSTIVEQVDNNKEPKQEKQTEQNKSSVIAVQIDNGKEVNQQKQTDLLVATDSSKDSSNTKPTVKLASGDTGKIAEIKNQINKKKRAAYFAIGLSEQEALRLDFHSEYTGSAYKNKFAIKDYIPSLYLRYYSKKRWFAQVEFKYAAPHYIKEFLYEKEIKQEPFKYISTSYVLKKIYSHELSLSYHHFVIPHLSAGVGVKYNIFSAATSQVDMKKKLYGVATDSLIRVC
ncbi:MAG: hypothetical protein ABI402_20830 [Ferruginibacter sp.]